MTVGTCLPSGEHVIPNGGWSGLELPHTLTLYRLSGNLSQNHVPAGLTLSRSAPPETAGVLPPTSNKGGTSPIFSQGLVGGGGEEEVSVNRQNSQF